VAVDTAGRSGMMVKHVTIHTNDRVTPATSVTVMLLIKAGTAGPN
jgi:hypothetical protein